MKIQKLTTTSVNRTPDLMIAKLTLHLTTEVTNFSNMGLINKSKLIAQAADVISLVETQISVKQVNQISDVKNELLKLWIVFKLRELHRLILTKTFRYFLEFLHVRGLFSLIIQSNGLQIGFLWIHN